MALWGYNEPDEEDWTFFFSPRFSKFYKDKNFLPRAHWEEQLQCGPVSSTTEQHPEWDMHFSYVIANNLCSEFIGRHMYSVPLNNLR